MTAKKKIPASTVNRLAQYLRVFSRLEKNGTETVSSREAADISGINPAQVRKDLAYFGQFGRRGVGYPVAELCEEIRRILGLSREWNVAILGAGHLGTALLMYRGFGLNSFNIVAAFDTDPDKINWELEGVTVYDLEELKVQAKKKKIEIAIIAVPAEEAQSVAEKAVAAGIPAVLNFAPARLDLPEKTLLRNVDFFSELEMLTYHLQN